MKQVREMILEGINPAGANASEVRFIFPITGRARIHAILINQRAGNMNGYFLELYSHKGACPTNYPTLDPAPPAPPNSPINYLVQPTLTVGSGNPAGVIRDSFGVPYTNTNNGHDGTGGDRTDEIYCRLGITSGDSGGSKIFDMRVVYSEQDS